MVHDTIHGHELDGADPGVIGNGVGYRSRHKTTRGPATGLKVTGYGQGERPSPSHDEKPPVSKTEGLKDRFPRGVRKDRSYDAHNWSAFLDDFQQHWPTDREHTYVEFIRNGIVGSDAVRKGNARWRRLTEVRAGRAKSVFHFDVQGSVAKSTHAGIPRLRFLRKQLGSSVHFWPSDGWEIPAGVSVIAEVYPSLWSGLFPDGGRTLDEHDAFSVAAWLWRSDRDGGLVKFLKPALTARERELAQLEGWILGVL